MFGYIKTHTADKAFYSIFKFEEDDVVRRKHDYSIRTKDVYLSRNKDVSDETDTINLSLDDVQYTYNIFKEVNDLMRELVPKIFKSRM